MTRSDDSGTRSHDDPVVHQVRQWKQVAQRHYEADRDGDLTTAIVFALAEAKDVLPTELKSPPLYDSVDVAGIEQTFFGLNNDANSRQGTGTVEFRYTEYLVTVRSDGWIQVYLPSESP